MSKITLYVDGACRGNPGIGGWGVYVEYADGQVNQFCGGDVDTTNNRMELMAAIQGISQLSIDTELLIWTDSSYVQKGITEWIVGWKKKNWKDVKNPDLWKILDKVCQGRKIDWRWIKGHAGHHGNEMADQLANRGADVVTQDTNQMNKIFSFDGTDLHYVADIQLGQDNANNDWLLSNPFGLDEEPTDEDELVVEESDESLPFQEQTSSTLRFNEPNEPQVIEVDTVHVDMLQTIDEVIVDVEDKPTKKSRKKPKRVAMLAEEVEKHIIITPANKKIQGQRQLILDTETTGFYYSNGDRIIEIGAIEMINRKLTGSSIHIYIQPEKEVGESVTVHGISDEFLQDKPIFSEVAQVLYDYLQGAEIIAHNASFDMNFLDMEFELVGLGKLSEVCTVVDTLAMAKAKHGGQRNTLDALVKRYEIPERDRTFHGALLDAEILADVYLAMTGGQVALDIQDTFNPAVSMVGQNYQNIQATLPVILASEEELQIHHTWQHKYDKKYPNAKPTVYYQLENPHWQQAYDERQEEIKQEQLKAQQEAERLKEEQEQQLLAQKMLEQEQQTINVEG